MKLKIMVNHMVLSGFTALTLISCDYILEKNENGDEIFTKVQTRININKKEAKLLLKASKNNLDIIEICEIIKYFDKQNNVGHLTTNLEKTHFEIAKNYNKLAEDKLISIPSYIKTNDERMEVKGKSIDDETFIKNNLKLILNKTQIQIQLLDALGNTTDNVEFKVLAIKDTHTLKSNINKIEITLNNLKLQPENGSTKKLIL